MRGLTKKQRKIIWEYAETQQSYMQLEDIDSDLIAQLEELNDYETLMADTVRYLNDLIGDGINKGKYK